MDLDTVSQESRFLDIDLHRYHYVDRGKGDVVLMLHGNPTWSFYYRNLARDLSQTHRVIVPDHMGCGLSDKPQDYAYTLQSHIANVDRLLSELDVDSVTLVVHDWGGLIGFGYAALHPHKIRSIVVLNSAAFWMPSLPLALHVLRTPLLGGFLVRRLNLFALAGAYFACTRKRLSKEIRRSYLRPYDSYENRVAVHRFIQDIPFSTTHTSHALLREIESALTLFQNTPMLLVWGERDPVFTMEFYKEWIRRFPSAESLVLDDAGHYVLEDAYTDILPVVQNFLTRHEK